MRVVLLGGGGHASDILGAIEAINPEIALYGKPIEVVGILADDEVNPKRFAHRNVKQIGTISDLPKIDVGKYVSAVGYPAGRKKLAEYADSVGLEPIKLVHPMAWVPDETFIGDGTVILAGCCVSPGVELGKHAYLSHGSLIGHDCKALDYATVMPGASVSGDTKLGVGALIGANATVLQGLSIGDWAVLGAGAVAVKDIPADVTAMGIPARW